MSKGQRDQGTATLLAGSAKRLITPTVKGRRVPMASRSGRRLATGIHDELWARAVAVRYGDVTLILVTLDLLGLSREDTEAIHELAAERAAPTEHLIVACTGNRAGPDTLGRRGRRPLRRSLNTRYLAFLRGEAAHVARLAVDAMEPAQACMARSEVVGLTGDTDGSELSVLQFRTPEGRRLATVVNFPLVPQVLEDSSTLISAGFPSWLCLDLERSREEVVLYVCADADEARAPAVRERSWDEVERVGRRLAAEARAALASASVAPIDRMGVWIKPISVLSTDRLAEWLGRVGLLPERVLAERRGDSEVGLIQLGPARMAVVPGLVAPQLGFEMRKMLDAPYRMLLCMSNGSLGFILPDDLAVSPAMARPSRRRNGSASADVHTATIILDGLDGLMLAAREEWV